MSWVAVRAQSLAETEAEAEADSGRDGEWSFVDLRWKEGWSYRFQKLPQAKTGPRVSWRTGLEGAQWNNLQTMATRLPHWD